MMKTITSKARLIRFAGVLSMAALIGACDSTTDISPRTEADLAGSFTADQATIRNVTTGETTDVIAGGGSANLELREDGTFTQSVALGSNPAVVTEGRFEVVSNDLIRFTPHGEQNADPVPYKYDNLNLAIDNSRFDFVFAEGVNQPAELTANFRRH